MEVWELRGRVRRPESPSPVPSSSSIVSESVDWVHEDQAERIRELEGVVAEQEFEVCVPKTCSRLLKFAEIWLFLKVKIVFSYVLSFEICVIDPKVW